MTGETIKLKVEIRDSKAWALIPVSLLIVDSGFTLKYSSVSQPGAKVEIFQGSGSFAKLRQFDKHFIQEVRKKSPARKNFGDFSLRYS